MKRLRCEAVLTQQMLANKMEAWGWYRAKVIDLEGSERYTRMAAEARIAGNIEQAESLEEQSKFELVPREMAALLAALGASNL